MTDRITWRDVQRLADQYANLLRQCDLLPPGIGLHVSPGSVTNGHAGGLYLTANGVDYPPTMWPIPGGLSLPRRARDAYINLSARIETVHHLRHRLEKP